MHEAVTRQFVLLAFYLSWLPIDVAEILLSEMVIARMARQTGVRITGQLGLGWETWGPYCGLVVDWCKRLGVEVVKAFVAFNLSDQQLRWHKDSGNVNVGRVVVNLGGDGVVNLRCGDEELCYRLPHGWGYFIGPVASGKALVSEAWKEKAACEEANLPPTQRDKQLQAGVVAAGRALSEAWKEKAAREDANLPPTQRDKQLQAGRAAAALTRKRKIENASGLLGYQDTMRS